MTKEEVKKVEPVVVEVKAHEDKVSPDDDNNDEEDIVIKPTATTEEDSEDEGHEPDDQRETIELNDLLSKLKK